MLTKVLLMEKFDYLIVSDIHLGDKDCKADLLLKVLKKQKAKNIIIAGDLFDHHNLHRLNKAHWKVLSKFRKLSKKCNIIYLIGNHCFLKAEFMSILLGFNCKDEHEVQYGNKKILIVHGDIFDIYFTRFKWITNFIIKTYYVIRHYTPFADDFFRLFKAKTNDFIEKSSDIKKNALKYIELNDYDHIICGHTHLPEDDNKYINTGSFCEKQCGYVTISKKGKIELYKL
jgi:UDP-2,3-diacylglucosamine pyrophosphatase LpxH